MVAWSYSNWSMFEECPYRFKAVVLEKRTPRPSGPALERGDRVHKELAARLTGQQETWPAEMPERIRRAVEQLIVRMGKPEVEQSLAVSVDLEPVGFFDENVAFRGKVDAFWLTDDGKVFVVDWKTGSSEAKPCQLELMLGLIAAHIPSTYTSFNARFVYLETSKYDDDPIIHMTYEDALENLRQFITCANEKYEASTFQPQPGSWCRWCLVHDCAHNPNRVPSFGRR